MNFCQAFCNISCL